MASLMSDRFLPASFRTKVEIIARTSLYDSWIKLTNLKLGFKSSRGEDMVIEREIHDHGSAACILPVDRQRRLALLVRQVRAPLVYNGEKDPMLLEVAAGLIDEGEEAAQTALREGEEELGYRLHDPTHVTTFYSSPGSLTERVEAYIASYGLYDKVSEGGGLAHEGEDVIVEEIALDELGEAVLQGKIRDAKTIILIQHLMLAEPELFF